MRKGSALLLICMIFFAGCQTTTPTQGDYVLYFPVDESVLHGSALGTQPLGEEDVIPDSGQLIQALLAGPCEAGLSNPFPKGVTLESWSLEEGTVVVHLSEQYGGLTDIDLSLADYCIVLTLSQLEEVEQVEIRSEGRGPSYRSHQKLRQEEAMLTSDQEEARQSADRSLDKSGEKLLS